MSAAEGAAVVNAESSTFSKGDRVDRFEIRELIGEGGMGAIYRALDTRLGRNVALKVVRPDRLGSGSGEEARQRFLREALAISKVDHRNVVRVLDFGYAGDTPYMAMEYLRGQDLGKLVKATTGFLPIADVIDVMLAVCAAIRACHEVGIIHRDLKPSNVFLCETDGERIVKILDFGVSKPTMASDLTREGQIVGTPQYLAPEQIDGKALPQTDQYAIGVMLYLCLTKELPYKDHASLGLFRAILLGKFTVPSVLRPELPQRLEAAIVRAMSTVPEERFDSVHALGRELWDFASPGAREQWRSYYHDDRLRPRPKASAHAMPLIEAMARGIGTPAAIDSLALASTAAARAPAAEKSAPAARKVAPIVEAATRTAAPPVRADARAQAITAEGNAGGTSGKRAAVAISIAAGVLIIAGAAWFVHRQPAVRNPPEASAPPAVQLAAPTPAPPPPAPATALPAPQRQAVPPEAPPLHAQKQHRRNNLRPPAEHQPDVAAKPADGVPIMP